MSLEKPVYVQLGSRKWQLGGEYLQVLEPCNPCLEAEDVGLALRNQLDEKGYIYLKHVIPEEEVLKARTAVLEYIQGLYETGTLQNPVFSAPHVDGILSDGCDVGCIPFMEGSNPITNHPSVFNIIEHPFLYDLFTSLFHGVPPATFNYKWLRGMHHGGNTGCHLDRVYMNRGSSQLLTCWIPLDNLTLDMSVLAVLEGSHRMDRSVDDGYTRLQNTYANMDVDRDKLQGTGWFTEDPMEFYDLSNAFPKANEAKPVWKTTAFSAGDILIFTMRTIHMSSVNLTNKLRLSCDTRWQPANEPVDPRFVQREADSLLGHTEAKFGLHAKSGEAIDDGKTTMEQWREKWGLAKRFEPSEH